MGVTSNAKPTAVSAGGRNLRVVGSRPQSAPAGLQTTYATQFSSPPSRLRPGTARPTDRKPSGSSPRAAARAKERGTSLREARHAICRANQAKVDALASRRQRRHEAMYERRLDGLFEQKSRWLQSVGSMGRPAATVEAAH